MSFRSRIFDWRNRTTIRKQLGMVTALLVALNIGFLIAFNYSMQLRENIRQQGVAMERLTTLENQRLDSYLSELEDYSLLLRSDANFMELIAREQPLSYTQRLDMENAFKTMFYYRNDLSRMELYALRQGCMLSIDSRNRKVQRRENVSAEALDDYDVFTAAPDYLSLQADADGFLVMSRTIIDSPRKTPLAVMRIYVTASQIDELRRSHVNQSERLFLFDEAGREYASEGEGGAAVWQTLEEGGQQCGLAGESCLIAASPAGASGYVLALAKPMAVANAATIQTRNVSIILGLLALSLTVALAIWFIHVLTEPLSTLAGRMQEIGEGDFAAKTDLQGSYEITGLSEEVNHMLENVSGLIDRTYVATLNERTAQLAALEAQTNPHFLFNTLQAISTEAIMEGDQRVYRMITALAAVLRYSIKGGNLAMLKAELDNVDKYLLLQKARFGSRLEYTVEADEALYTCNVPKMGLLTLVENSIIHGMDGQTDGLKIAISCQLTQNGVRLCVRDDGNGMEPQRVVELNEMMAAGTGLNTQRIGLSNLASRIQLLYNGKARLTIESRQAVPRRTEVSLMIPTEVFYVPSVDS